MELGGRGASFLVIRDNGRGMNASGLKAFATYFLTQVRRRGGCVVVMVLVVVVVVVVLIVVVVVAIVVFVVMCGGGGGGENQPSWLVPVSTLFKSWVVICTCLLYTSPSPRDRQKSRMPSSA